VRRFPRDEAKALEEEAARLNDRPRREAPVDAAVPPRDAMAPPRPPHGEAKS
jgi:hypothetical protein